MPAAPDVSACFLQCYAAAASEHRDVRSPRSLLAKAERKLRAGKILEAVKLFEEIVDGHGPSLEQLAALAYLRGSERKPPRRAQR
jgi:hypothetical protein